MDQKQPINLLLITGPTGVGKSAVADAAYEALKAQGIPVALINIDELGYAAPAPTFDPYNEQLRLKNLASIWPNYRLQGFTSVIIPAVIENEMTAETYRQAVPGANLQIVQLTAPISVIEERLQNRPMGGSLEWHVKRAAELISVFRSANFSSLKIDTQDKTVGEIALDVINAWHRGSSPQD